MLDTKQVENHPELQAAIELACKWHSTQVRKHDMNGIFLPYICHPMQVMAAIWRLGAGSIDNLKAAVCHDLLEDTGCTYNELKSVIGEKAARIVDELTFHQVTSNTVADKQEYLRGFSKKSIDSLMIKIADRICNVLDFYPFNPDYALEYFHKADSVFTAFYDRYREIQTQFGPGSYDTTARSIRNMETMLHKGSVTFSE